MFCRIAKMRASLQSAIRTRGMGRIEQVDIGGIQMFMSQWDGEATHAAYEHRRHDQDVQQKKV